MWVRRKIIIAAGVTLVGGGTYLASHSKITAGSYSVYPISEECTGDNCPVTKWDSNWDMMNQKESDEEQPSHNFRRHVILIRNGQYNVNGKTEKDKTLTELGKAQIQAVASRLVTLNLPYSYMAGPPSTRGKESFRILSCKLKPPSYSIAEPLTEGFPVAPSPKIANLADDALYHRDVMRMEHAFRTIFRRLSDKKKADSFEICICPANTIRYFICRALQFPPQGWLRFQIAHASITWLIIDSNGTVTAQCIADHGFLPPDKVTF